MASNRRAFSASETTSSRSDFAFRQALRANSAESEIVRLPESRNRIRKMHPPTAHLRRPCFPRAGAHEQDLRGPKLPDELRGGREIQKRRGQNRLRTHTGAQRAGAVRRRRNNRFAANLFRRVFARRVAEVKIAATGLAGANFHAVAFAAEENAGLFLANGKRFGNFSDRDYSFRPVVQRGYNRARGAEHVKHHARGVPQITLRERGKFRR